MQQKTSLTLSADRREAAVRGTAGFPCGAYLSLWPNGLALSDGFGKAAAAAFFHAERSCAIMNYYAGCLLFRQKPADVFYSGNADKTCHRFFSPNCPSPLPVIPIPLRVPPPAYRSRPAPPQINPPFTDWILPQFHPP